MEAWVEVLKVLCTWPPILLVTIVFVSWKFNGAIEGWIGRLSIRASYKEFGFVAQSQITEVAKEKQQEPPPAGVDQQVPSATPIDPKILEQSAKAWRTTAYVWEYRYLNYFLRGNSQRALDFLYSANEKMTLNMASMYVAQYAPDQAEQRAILDALQAHYLVEVDMSNNLIGISPKGREYVEFRGRPTLPTPAPTSAPQA